MPLQSPNLAYGLQRTPVFDGPGAVDLGNITRPWLNFFQWLASQSQSAGDTYPWLSVKATGAKGDGLADDTLAIQAAVSQERTVFLPNGTYQISNTILLNPNAQLIGESRAGVIINMEDDAKYAFGYLSDIQSAPYEIDTGLVLLGFTINAKYGIKLNQDILDIGGTDFDNQAFLKGVIFHNLIFTGTYGLSADPGYGTSTPPTLDELKDFGVAIEWNKVFDSELSNTQIQAFGIALLEGGCDINRITLNRFHENARHRHVRGFSTPSTFLGSQDLLLHNDILVARRIYGTYLDGTHFQMFTDNYWENAIVACSTVLKTVADLGTKIEGNRFDGSFGDTVPYMDLDPTWNLAVLNNKWNGTTPIPFVTIGNTYWDPSHPQQILWADNDPDMPGPDWPEAFLAPLNQYLMRYNNHGLITGLACVAFPWEVSSVTGRWCVKLTDPTFIWQANLKVPSDRKLLLEYVARKVTGGGTANVRYVEDNEPCTANPATDTITAVAHGKSNGDQIRFRSTQSLPGGISPNTNYYVISAAANTLQISTSLAGPAVDITSAGTGTIYLQNWWQLCVLPLGFTSTTATATRTHTVRLPLEAKGIGYIEGEVSNDVIELESIEITPVSYELGTAAPVSGSYLVGEVMFNTAPTYAGPSGWINTVAGSPGTWEWLSVVGIPILVPQGGTGRTTLGANGVLIGQAGAAVNVTGAGTVGQVLTSGGAGVDPTFQAPTGSTLPVVDTTAIVKGSSDATKLVRIEADGLTTATTRVATMPDRDITLNKINHLEANASADLTCTTSYADVTGMTVTLTETGDYLITADCEIGLTVDANEVLCQLLVNGAAQTGVVRLLMSTGTGTDSMAASVSRTWLYSNTGSNVAKIQAKKTINAGAGQVHQVNSSISAIFLG